MVESGRGSSDPELQDVVSDESSFYGDDDTKRELESKVASYDSGKHFERHSRLPQVVAATNRDNYRAAKKRNLPNVLEPTEPGDVNDGPSTSNLAKEQSGSGPIPQLPAASTPYNSLEGLKYAKQLSESVSNFLSRLPPSRTRQSDVGPYIGVENPHTTLRSTSPNANIAAFLTSGRELLEAHLSARARHEEDRDRSRKTAAATTHKIAHERNKLETRLRELARTYGITGGKWMLFMPRSSVDEIWATVTTATVEGKLGCAAKVFTANDEIRGNGQDEEEEQRKEKERHEETSTQQARIFVYTADCEDELDVKDVLLRLRDLGVLDAVASTTTISSTGGSAGGGGIYYKCDAWTYLDLKSGNRYGIKTSMYSSWKLLPSVSGKRRGSGRVMGRRNR